MLERIRSSPRLQLALGLAMGFCFGFLLQKGWVTHYEVIVRQLLLQDFTVAKVILSAIIVGMVGVHLMRDLGWVELHPKAGSWARDVLGGLLFGVGFALLGYCPGTGVGAAAQGNLDALIGGCVGIGLGAWLFAVCYPWMEKHVLHRGELEAGSLALSAGVHRWFVVAAACGAMLLALGAIEGLA